AHGPQSPRAVLPPPRGRLGATRGERPRGRRSRPLGQPIRRSVETRGRVAAVSLRALLLLATPVGSQADRAIRGGFVCIRQGRRRNGPTDECELAPDPPGRL